MNNEIASTDALFRNVVRISARNQRVPRRQRRRTLDCLGPLTSAYSGLAALVTKRLIPRSFGAAPTTPLSRGGCGLGAQPGQAPARVPSLRVIQKLARNQTSWPEALNGKDPLSDGLAIYPAILRFLRRPCDFGSVDLRFREQISIWPKQSRMGRRTATSSENNDLPCIASDRKGFASSRYSGAHAAGGQSSRRARRGSKMGHSGQESVISCSGIGVAGVSDR
jgi:hypothetical protein